MKKHSIGIALTLALVVTGCTQPTPADKEGPKVTFTVNKTEFTGSGNLELKATATDPAGIERVEFLEDGKEIFEDKEAPYEHNKAIGFSNNGTHTYTVIAYDKLGNKTTYTPSISVKVAIPEDDKTPPTASLLAYKTLFVDAGELTLAATAEDNVKVTRVELFDGATLVNTLTAPNQSTKGFIFKINITEADNGTHNYTVKAYDKAGNSVTSNTATVKVEIDKTNPNVTLAASATTITENGQLKLTADATDNMGITKVEFYKNGVLLPPADTTAPYETTLNLTSADNGTLTFTAKAYDKAGNTKVSSAVVVNVAIPVNNPEKVAEQAFNDLALVQTLPTQLDAQTKEILLLLGIDVSKMLPPTQGQQAFNQQGVQQGIQVSEAIQQLMPQATTSLPTGTYTEDVNGDYLIPQFGNRKFKKTAETPSNGIVVNLSASGKAYTYTATYGKTVVFNPMPNYPVEVVVTGSIKLTEGANVLADLNLTSDATACEQVGLKVTQGNAYVKIGSAIDWTGGFTSNGGQYNASTTVSVVAGPNTVTGSATFAGNFSAPIPGLSSCTNGQPYSVNVNSATLNADLKVNSTQAKLNASALNLQNVVMFSNAPVDVNNLNWAGDVDAKLTVQIPGFVGDLFTAKGNIKDGTGDADNLPGDQVPVVLYVKNQTGLIKVNSTMQKLLFNK